MYGGLPFTGAPILYAAIGVAFVAAGSVARGVDYLKNRSKV